MAACVRRGELQPPDDDALADAYELADDILAAAGFTWYEVSNWTRTPADACRHNVGYWLGHDWWGIGPGAHSHVGGVRWWNVRHPRLYAARLADGVSPAQAREVLSPQERNEERVLLGVRLAEGLPVADLDAAARRRVAGLVADGLVEPAAVLGSVGERADRERRIVLTRRGRLLADAVVRSLLP
jgi:coproporphyrinogen III oxidase-like Fe-S oxidoreductase